MEGLLQVVRRHAYNSYYAKPELLEPIFHLFEVEADCAYLMRNVSEATHVPITTLYSWREHFRANPSWRPSREHFAENRRIFSDEVEELIADFIRINFVQLGRSLTRATLQPLILVLVQDLIAESVLDQSFLNFKCSRHFLSRFLPRVGLSFRRARAARRPVIDDQECLRFLGQLTAAYHRYPPHLILNFDESNWHLVMAGEETVAERGAESVHQYVDGDPKANFSFFATITAEGQKLPLILIAKGKTVRCHKQFGNHDQHQFDVWHSPSGWSTELLMLDYLEWLRRQMPPEPLCLLMDQYGTHTTDAVNEKAEALGIELIWIPRGATGRYQPLDRRTFGALKAKGKAKWRHEFTEHYGMGCTREIGAELLLQSWSELSDSAVAAGWDYAEELDEYEESDDPDDEFHLQMATDTDDEDIVALQHQNDDDEDFDATQPEEVC
jgi:hypothetical protein